MCLERTSPLLIWTRQLKTGMNRHGEPKAWCSKIILPTPLPGLLCMAWILAPKLQTSQTTPSSQPGLRDRKVRAFNIVQTLPRTTTLTCHSLPSVHSTHSRNRPRPREEADKRETKGGVRCVWECSADGLLIAGVISGTEFEL